MTESNPPAMPPPAGAPTPGPVPGADVVAWWRRRVAMLPLWAWVGLLLAGVVGTVVSTRSGGEEAAPATTTVFVVDTRPAATSSGGDVAVDPTTTAVDPTTTAVDPTTTAAEPTTEVSTTVAPTTTVASTTTVAATTTVAPTTTAASTTVAPTSTVAPDGSIDLPGPVTVSGPDGETLTIVPRRAACRYGDRCLVVGFEVDGLPRWPLVKNFTCEFSSGARYVFRFSGTSVDTACVTADVPDSVVVTVAGIRSEVVFVER